MGHGREVAFSCFKLLRDGLRYRHILVDEILLLVPERHSSRLGASGAPRLVASLHVGFLQVHRLNKLASNKMRMRTTGKRNILSNQPSQGPGEGEGAQRVGEMETKAFSAHGAAHVLDDAMLKRSDGTTLEVCSGCGNAHFMLGKCMGCGGNPVKVRSSTAAIRSMQLYDAQNIAVLSVPKM